MVWLYLSVAAVVAATAFVVAGCRVADHPALCAVIAGLIWPVLLLGLGEFLLIATARRVASAPRSHGRRLPDAFAETRT